MGCPTFDRYQWELDIRHFQPAFLTGCRREARPGHSVAWWRHDAVRVFLGMALYGPCWARAGRATEAYLTVRQGARTKRNAVMADVSGAGADYR